MLVPAFIQNLNSQKKVDLIATYFSENEETVLDFGCGDLSFAKALKSKRKNFKL